MLRIHQKRFHQTIISYWRSTLLDLYPGHYTLLECSLRTPSKSVLAMELKKNIPFVESIPQPSASTLHGTNIVQNEKTT